MNRLTASLRRNDDTPSRISKRLTRAACNARMIPTKFDALLTSLRHMHERICAMTAEEALHLRSSLAAEAAHLCERAGLTDSNIQRFAADIVDEAVRRRHLR